MNRQERKKALNIKAKKLARQYGNEIYETEGGFWERSGEGGLDGLGHNWRKYKDGRDYLQKNGYGAKKIRKAIERDEIDDIPF